MHFFKSWISSKYAGRNMIAIIRKTRARMRYAVTLSGAIEMLSQKTAFLQLPSLNENRSLFGARNFVWQQISAPIFLFGGRKRVGSSPNSFLRADMFFQRSQTRLLRRMFGEDSAQIKNQRFENTTFFRSFFVAGFFSQPLEGFTEVHFCLRACNEHQVPWVLDPVAAGFTPLRYGNGRKHGWRRGKFDEKHVSSRDVCCELWSVSFLGGGHFACRTSVATELLEMGGSRGSLWTSHVLMLER